MFRVSEVQLRWDWSVFNVPNFLSHTVFPMRGTVAYGRPDWVSVLASHLCSRFLNTLLDWEPVFSEANEYLLSAGKLGQFIWILVSQLCLIIAFSVGL